MQNYKRIPVFDIKIGELEKKYVKDCLDTSWLGQGSYVKNLEEKFSNFVECDYGITTTSGTTALHIACASWIILKSGDEVLVSTLTNMACAFSVDYCNATNPYRCWLWYLANKSKTTRKKINKKTKAIMVVHLFGHPVDMDPVIALAKNII